MVEQHRHTSEAETSTSPAPAAAVGAEERMLRRLVPWARRRPAAAVLAGLVLVGLLVYFGLRENRRLQRHNDELRTGEERERQARLRAEAGARRARQDFQELLADVGQESLANVPHVELARRELLERALARRQAFLNEAGDDPATRLEAGRAWADLGQIHEMLKQHAAAENAYGESIKLLKELAKDFPKGVEYCLELADSHHKLGILLHALGRREQAVAEYAEALGLLDNLPGEPPDPDAHRFERGRVHVNLGNALREMPGGRPRAEKGYLEAVGIFERLRAASPNVPRYGQKLAGAWANLGILWTKERARHADAEGAFDQAKDLLQGLTSQHPRQRDYRRELAVTHSSAAKLYWYVDRAADAEAAYRAARDLLAGLRRDFPSIPQYRFDLALACEDLGNLLYLVRPGEEAFLLGEEALALKEGLVEDFPAVPDYRSGLALSLQYRAAMLRDRARLVAVTPETSGWRLGALTVPPGPDPWLAVGLLALGRAPLAEARRCWGCAAGHQRLALAADRQNVQYSTFLRDHLYYYAEVSLFLGDHREAARAAADLPGGASHDPENAFRAGQLLARCAALAGRDAGLAEAERRRTAQEYAGRAVGQLRDAVRWGFKDVGALEGDAYLAPLRERDDFQKLVRDLRPSR